MSFWEAEFYLRLHQMFPTSGLVRWATVELALIVVTEQAQRQAAA